MTYFQLFKQLAILHQDALLKVLAVVGALVILYYMWRLRDSVLKAGVCLCLCIVVSYVLDLIFNAVHPDPTVNMIMFVAFIVLVVILAYTI